jgi:menaquinone-dependent protoporphyrinogen oxidase
MGKMTRREFVARGSIMAGGTLAGLMMGGGLFSPPKALGKEIQFPESSCEAKKKIKNKILIAYASFCGTTGEVAEAVGRDLCEQGAQADVRLVKNIKDISSYDGAVVGSSVRNASWLPEAIDFVQNHRERLGCIPVAYFLTCVTLFKDTAETRELAKSYMNRTLTAAPYIQPVDQGFFAGVLDYSKLNIIYRTIMKSKMEKKGIPEGDFRNWEAIHAWVRGLYPAFSLGGRQNYR